MKRSTYYLFTVASVFILISCNQTTKKNSSKQPDKESETLHAREDVDQLTYQDVVAMVYDDEGERIEWHGEEMSNDLTQFLTISKGDPCGEEDCGKILSLINSADQTITLVIRGDYDIEGDQGYIPRKYIIPATDTLLIGCSHLCYGGKSYEFQRTIVGSKYVEMN
ncbi:hypothetical protein [Ekhidna sp.]